MKLHSHNIETFLWYTKCKLNNDLGDNRGEDLTNIMRDADYLKGGLSIVEGQYYRDTE